MTDLFAGLRRGIDALGKLLTDLDKALASAEDAANKKVSLPDGITTAKGHVAIKGSFPRVLPPESAARGQRHP